MIVRSGAADEAEVKILHHKKAEKLRQT